VLRIAKGSVLEAELAPARAFSGKKKGGAKLPQRLTQTSSGR